jgi:hypothetical protein
MASIRVGVRFGCGVFPAVGIIGSTGVGIVETRSTGCVLIGPAVGLILAMVDNSLRPNLFNGCEAESATLRYRALFPGLPMTSAAASGASIFKMQFGHKVRPPIGGRPARLTPGCRV